MRFFQRWSHSEENVAIGLALCILCVAVYACFVISRNAYIYQRDAASTYAEIVQVKENRKYDIERHKWVSWLDAQADYTVGSVKCRIKLDRMPTSQAGYDRYRKGKKILVHYFPDLPCSGKTKPYRSLYLALALGSFALLFGGALAFKIRSKRSGY